ncbi:SAM hydroxide adenosyltransferase [Maridesulfovibrio sp.]
MTIPEEHLLSSNDDACVKRVSCYAELQAGATGLLAGSQGYYELALNRGAASEMLGLEPGDVLTLKF